MNEDLLGGLDSLESMVLTAKNVPFSQNIILNEKKVLNLIDKLRQIIASQHQSQLGKMTEALEQDALKDDLESKASQLLNDAQKQSQQLKFESHAYADDIFVRLQLMVAKLRKNLVKLDQNIEQGRKMLDDNLQPLQSQAQHKETSHDTTKPVKTL